VVAQAGSLVAAVDGAGDAVVARGRAGDALAADQALVAVAEDAVGAGDLDQGGDTV
jgi:hypothetical protein